MQRQGPVKILISGGGTGGHVFPAIAIANALKEIDNDIQIRFIGAKDRLEMQKVPEAGFQIDGLWISGIQRGNLFKNLALPFKILSSLIKVNRIIKSFKPDVMVGVGGYASGPAMYVAAKKGIPVLIQEQNSFAGVTNRLMAKKANRFCVAYDGMDRFFPKERIVKTGNPVRKDIAFMTQNRSQAQTHFGLSEERKTVLIIGGSLGARTINESIKASIEKLLRKDTQVIWQTGKLYFEEMKTGLPESDRIKIFDFIREMNLAYSAADVIVSRAGAIAISELCLVKKPVILVPSPNVAEDHQTKNALALVEKNAALMVKDVDARKDLVEIVTALLGNAGQQQELKKNIGEMGIPNASERIAKEVLSLVN